MASIASFAQNSYTINNGWDFRKLGQNWEKVDIPHTWNAEDSRDDKPGFWRGVCEYKKEIFIPLSSSNKRLFLHFEAANQETELYINDKFVTRHEGGYTMFSTEISQYINFGQKNKIRLLVDNKHNPDIPPLSADFTFFGGIYRDITLVEKEPTHISILDKASSGVYISTPEVNDNSAKVHIKVLVNNGSNKNQKCIIEHRIISPDGLEIKTLRTKFNLEANALNKAVESEFAIKNPALWSPDSPQLYTVKTLLLSEKELVLDNSYENFGLRWFHFDANKGFFLNGKALKLIGTNRHQCFKDKGYALDDSYHINDIRLIKEMGGNFLRVSHYPQDPLVLDMCDKLGILCSVEIPIVNAITESEAFLNNCLNMTEEMVKQSYNHPSVVLWAYMNEVMLRSPYNRKSNEYKNYCKEVHRQAVMIENLIRKLDPYRWTMLPCHANLKNYEEANLVKVPMTLGFNVYRGWYSGEFKDLDLLFESIHKKYPDVPLMMSEYGADNDTRIHASKISESFDYSVEYADLYQEYYLDYVLKTDFLAGAFLWNLNEFYSEPRSSAVPHVNLKGIVKLDREPKNTYWLYKANLSKEGMLQFGNSDWTTRSASLDENGVYKDTVRIYSNQTSATIIHNGKELGDVNFKMGMAKIIVPFVNGENRLLAYTNTYESNIAEAGSNANELLTSNTNKSHIYNNKKYLVSNLNVNFQGIAHKLDNTFTELNVLLGSNRTFTEISHRLCWIAEKEYSEGSWGYIGGSQYRPKSGNNTLPAAEINILGTDNDPMYQTQRRGIEAFRADVPDGRYAIYLHWAELVKPLSEALAYNLGRNSLYEEYSNRCFDVYVNGRCVIENLNVIESVGPARPLIIKTFATASNNEGLKIEFKSKTGETFLSAVRIVKYD